MDSFVNENIIGSNSANLTSATGVGLGLKLKIARSR